MAHRGSYYYGSYGLIRGYGPLHRTLKEADNSVFEDGRKQRRNGGSTDRNAVYVTPEDGLCWWADEDNDSPSDLAPVRTPDGSQARYTQEVIRAHEQLWHAPRELPGFG